MGERMTVSENRRKVGINVSIPFKHIETIDSKARSLNMKRSNYIWSLIKKDLDLDERD